MTNEEAGRAFAQAYGIEPFQNETGSFVFWRKIGQTDHILKRLPFLIEQEYNYLGRVYDVEQAYAHLGIVIREVRRTIRCMELPSIPIE